MGGLFLTVIFIFAAIVLSLIKFPAAVARTKKLATIGCLSAATVTGLLGAFSYNDAGFQQHVRTIFGTESAVLDTGWYFEGWGRSTSWPKFITVANTLNQDAGGSSITGPYRVRLADNWTGDVTQSTRFQIPTDAEQFIRMSQTFRSLDRLVNSTLMPDVNASIDSVANMYTMEEYYSGGKRDQFKTEFFDTVTKGRAMVRQISLNQAGGVIPSRARPNDDEATDDTALVGDTDVRRVVMEKVLGPDGNPVRVQHAYPQFGITVSQAILEGIDPDDEYERQINDRKSAASRRVVAREQRLEQEEQRLLAIQSGATEIAKRQAAAQVEQIERTTNAETEKQLVLIGAGRMQEEAAIARDTARINLDRARIDAEAVTVAADAEAYAKEAILLADGALAQKLEAWVQAQTVWAAAAADLQVPSTVIGGGSGEGVNSVNSAQTLMDLLMVNSAKQLSLDPTIAAPRQ
jgi:hypothetical protein